MPYAPWMRTGPDPSPERTARRAWRARWFAAALSAIVQLPGVAITLVGAAHGQGSGVDAFAVSAVLAGLCAAVLLLLPWRGPRVLAVALFAVAAIGVAPGPPLAALAVAFAVGDAVVSGAAVWAWSTLIGMGVVGATALAVNGASGAGIRVLIVTIVLCLIAGLATGAGARRERFRAAAREEAGRRRSAAEEERTRIARELHDVLAHSLSQISVQAGVGLHLFDEQPDRARESLRSIRETSTTALDEVRSVLGVLRERDESAPPRSPGATLEALPGLIESVRATGLVVAAEGVEANASVDTPIAVQAAAYRIVQESLTNVRRHAPGSEALVHLTVSPDAIAIVVENGPGEPVDSDSVRASTHHGGRGVLGMRERATALGGTLTAEPRADGGFTVTAILPVVRGGGRR